MNDLFRHKREFLRAANNHHYEVTPNGILFPKQQAIVAGTFTHWVNDRDMCVDSNVVPIEGLKNILANGVGNNFLAPFLNNITPGSSLNAADFTGDFQEFTDYAETARPAWTVPADPDDPLYTNVASPGVFSSTVDVEALDVWGAVLISSSPKESTTGVVNAGSKFTVKRTLTYPDKLTLQYDLSAVST